MASAQKRARPVLIRRLRPRIFRVPPRPAPPHARARAGAHPHRTTHTHTTLHLAPTRGTRLSVSARASTRTTKLVVALLATWTVRSKPMMEELRHLWRLPADNDIQIEAESITSAANAWADALSRDRGVDDWTFGRRTSPCLPHALAHLRACRVGATWGCRPGLCVGDMSPLPNTMSKRAPGAPPRAWPAAAGGRTAFPSSRGRAADRASRRRPAPPQDLCPGKRRVARRYHNPPLPSHTWRARRRVVQRVRRSRGLLLRQVACARCCCWRQARRRGAARLAAR